MEYNHKYSFMNIKYNYNYTCINMKILNFKDFMKKYNLKNDTMNESQLQEI